MTKNIMNFSQLIKTITDCMLLGNMYLSVKKNLILLFIE